MTNKKSNDSWWIAGLVIAGLLYYVHTGVGKENDSALIPNTIEGEIDFLVAALNRRFGRRWVDVGVGILKGYAQSTLPTSIVNLVAIVAAVENMSKGWMTGPAKQQIAVQISRGR